MQITLARTKRDHLAFASFTQRISSAQRKTYWSLYGGLLAMVLFQVVPHLYSQLGISALRLFVPLAIVIALLFFHAHWLLFIYGQSWWRIHQPGQTSGTPVSVHTTLTPQGIAETQLPSGPTTNTPWAQARSLHDTKRHLFLSLTTGATLIFPKRYFASAADAQRFIEYAQHHAASSATFSYVKENAQQRQAQSLCNAMALLLTFSLGGWTLWTVFANLDYVAPPPSPPAYLRSYFSQFNAKRRSPATHDSSPYEEKARGTLMKAVSEQLRKRDTAAAVAVCELAIRQSSQAAWPYQTLAMVYQYAHCPLAAWQTYEHALRLDPDSVEAVYGQISLARQLGRAAEVEGRLLQLVERDLDGGYARLRLAQLYEASQRQPEALIALRRVLKDSPHSLGTATHSHLFRMRLQRAQGWFADDATLRRQLLRDEGEAEEEEEVDDETER